ncbi:efflux RND transporter permease subunit [Aliamphritea ceti]|uniref:efflux RND transporter permease subunit n=1 Tax=Aliamphritea ceti TaxID=1524258 RepID=UPI0021C408B6|nr:MMPL family transporter [Aliamphritea ceti]
MQLFPGQKYLNFALLILLPLAIAGLQHLTTNASFLAYFDRNDPLFAEYQRLQENFTSRERLLVVVQSRDGRSLLEEDGFYRQSRALHQQLEALPEVVKVRGFLTALKLKSNIFLSRDARQVLDGSFISADNRTALLVLDVALENRKSARQILAFNGTVSAQVKDAYSDNIVGYLSGTMALNNAYIDTVRHDLKYFIPLLLGIMFSLLWWSFRRLAIPLLLMGVGTLSTLAAFGVISWMGHSVTAINAFTPIIIIGLSLVTAMHNVLSFYQARANGKVPADAIRDSFAMNIKPLTLSCLTTAVGFLALLFSPSPPVMVTGIAAAVGLLVSYLLTISWLQLGLKRFTPSIAIADGCMSRLNVSRLACRGHKRIVTAAALLLLLGGWGLTQLQVDDNVYEYFPEDYSFRKSVNIIDTELSGASGISYVISTENASAFSLNDLQQLDAFTAWLSTQQEVLKIVPGSRALRQPDSWLRLAEEQLYNPDTHMLKLRVRMPQQSARAMIAFDDRVRQWVQENPGSLNIYTGGSADLMFAHLSISNAQSMLLSLLVALFAISLFIGWMFRGWRLMTLVFICNFAPLILAYGLLGISGGAITLGSAVVMGMIIGIIVDDSLHILFKYRRYRRSEDESVALQRLWTDVIPAVFISSLTMILALSVGLLSDFKPIFEISLFSILIIFIALLADMYLLPSLLKNRFFQRHFR